MKSPILRDLHKAFATHADTANAQQMAAYMQNHFPFFGIKSVERRQLQKTVLKAHPQPKNLAELKAICSEAWQLPQREFQYFAQELLKKQSKLTDVNFVKYAQNLITDKPWWDTVDMLAVHAVGKLVLCYPELKTTMDKWAKDKNLWVRRSAIIHQLSYKTQTDEQRLFEYCVYNANSKEFFIQKAMGWALRQYSKISPQSVSRFIANEPLPSLTKREGMKWLRRRRETGDFKNVW